MNPAEEEKKIDKHSGFDILFSNYFKFIFNLPVFI